MVEMSDFVFSKAGKVKGTEHVAGPAKPTDHR